MEATLKRVARILKDKNHRCLIALIKNYNKYQQWPIANSWFHHCSFLKRWCSWNCTFSCGLSLPAWASAGSLGSFSSVLLLTPLLLLLSCSCVLYQTYKNEPEKKIKLRNIWRWMSSNFVMTKMTNKILLNDVFHKRFASLEKNKLNQFDA